LATPLLSPLAVAALQTHSGEEKPLGARKIHDFSLGMHCFKHWHAIKKKT
jgi:hypothetical protein